MPRRAPAEDKSVSDGADEVEAVQRCLATIKADNALRHRGQDMEKRHDDAPRPSHLNKTQIALSMPRLKAMERPDLRYALEQFERDDAAQLAEEAE